MAEKFDMSPEEAEKKFKNIRTAFGRYLKKAKSIPLGSGRDAVPVPREFESLDWLAGIIGTRPCVSNLKPQAVKPDDEDSEAEENIVESQSADEPEHLNGEEIQGDDDILEVTNDSSTSSSAGQLGDHDKTPRQGKRDSKNDKRNKKDSKEDVDLVFMRTESILAESLKKNSPVVIP